MHPLLKQLAEAKQGCLKAIEGIEKASASDGIDRSASVKSLQRDIASYDAQAAKLQPAPVAPQDQIISIQTK